MRSCDESQAFLARMLQRHVALTLNSHTTSVWVLIDRCATLRFFARPPSRSVGRCSDFCRQDLGQTLGPVGVVHDFQGPKGPLTCKGQSPADAQESAACSEPPSWVVAKKT